MRRIALAAFATLLCVAPGTRADTAKPKPFKPSEAGDSTVVKRSAVDQPHMRLDGDGAKTPPAVSDEDSRFATVPEKKALPAPARPEASVPWSYGGVIPGGANLPPHPPKPSAKGPARMTWPGFQVLGAVPTVFLELTAPVEWSVEEGDGKLVYTLKNTTVPLRNNTRPLRVGEFKTAVNSIDARPSGRDVRVTISLKSKVAHKESTQDAAGGFKMLVVGLTPRE